MSIIKKTITERAVRCLNLLPLSLLQDEITFYIGGGCLVMDKPNDYDIFVQDPEEVYQTHFNVGYELVYKSKNALTIKKGKYIIQLCNYWKPTLKELVDSFDFAHIQVGVTIGNFDENYSYYETSEDRVINVYYTKAYVESLLTGRTRIANTRLEYPMSTVLRTQKYFERGLMSKKNYICQMVYAMSQVCLRGIKNYEDFKDQLEAVDLMFEVDDVNDTILLEAYNNFMRG